MRLLCIGDVHLGRQPSRLPAELPASLRGGRLGPGEAWRRAVRYAIEQEVDGVLLAGDVVEDEQDFYEAYADLKKGVENLTGADIPVVGVAGNHDVEVLPRLADAVPGFRLLGRGGQWGGVELTGTGGDQVRVVGWSFPEKTVRASPLAAGLPAGGEEERTRTGRPTVGLLHCDCDQQGSPYAPVTSSELEGALVDAWILGHIHRPHLLSRPRRAVYLGSLTGLDPGETGARGPWVLEVFPDRDPLLEQTPLAPLRWEEVQVSVEGLESPEEVDTRVVRALQEVHERVGKGAYPPEAVGCRLRLVGRTPFRNELERRFQADRAEQAVDPRNRPQQFGSVWYFVHDVHVGALPAIDLEELAAGGEDPVSLLARRIVLLRAGGSEERRALIAEGRRRLVSVQERAPYSRLQNPGEAPDLEDTEVAEVLEAAGLHALDRLLAQRDGGL